MIGRKELPTVNKAALPRSPETELGRDCAPHQDKPPGRRNRRRNRLRHKSSLLACRTLHSSPCSRRNYNPLGKRGRRYDTTNPEDINLCCTDHKWSGENRRRLDG